MSKPLTISARAKGFPLRLSVHTYFTIQVTYPFLVAIGATDSGTDAALALLPLKEISKAAIEEAAATGDWDNGGRFWSSRTIRVRAEHLEGMIKLLNLVAAFSVAGSTAYVLLKRVESLRSVSALDMLADAAR